MPDAERNGLRDELMAKCEELELTIAERAERLRETQWEQDRDKAMRERCRALLEMMVLRPQYYAVRDDSDRTRLTLVDAIDEILCHRASEDIPMAQGAILLALEEYRALGRVDKIPKENSLRAMLSQYRVERGWVFKYPGFYRTPKETDEVPF